MAEYGGRNPSSKKMHALQVYHTQRCVFRTAPGAVIKRRRTARLGMPKEIKDVLIQNAPVFLREKRN